MIKIGRTNVKNGDQYTKNNFPKGSPNLDTDGKILIIYDIDSPNPSFLHYYEINRNVITSYYPPSPPEGNHQYIVRIYSSEDFYDYNYVFTKRNGFNPDRFFGDQELEEEFSFFVSA